MNKIDERREYVAHLLEEGFFIEPQTIKSIAKNFNSSYSAVLNDIDIAITGETRYKKPVTTGENTRARRLGLEGEVSLDEWLTICKRHDNKCAVCRKEKPLTMDHIQPFSKGGKHCVENIQPLCKSCNSRKKDK